MKTKTATQGTQNPIYRIIFCAILTKYRFPRFFEATIEAIFFSCTPYYYFHDCDLREFSRTEFEFLLAEIFSRKGWKFHVKIFENFHDWDFILHGENKSTPTPQ